MISCEKLSYPTLVETMLVLTMVVEEKIAQEIKGVKGTILHDGWSKFSRHYVCLLASYLVSDGKRCLDGEIVLRPVTTMLTCTTLPQANDDEGKIHLYYE